MKIIKQNILINRPVKCGNCEIGVDGDIIVPDIKPDILKILQVDGKAVVCDTELNEGNLTVSGRIDLNILYVPDRNDEKIKSIETSFDFLHHLDRAEIMPDMHASVNAEILKLDFHVLNSRKLRVKTAVGIAYEICEQSPLELATGTDTENAELLITPIELTSLLDLKHSVFSVRENFELPPGHSQIEEILKSDIKVCDCEYKIISGRIAIKGTLGLSCLYLDSNCDVRCCDFETGFTELFDIANADDDTICDISFSVKESLVRPECDSDGDINIIALDSEIAVKITATKKVDTEILVDCFLPGNKTEINKTPTELEKTVATGFYQSTLREIISPDASYPHLKGIYNVYAVPTIEKTEVFENKTTVTGNISYCILYIAESEDTPVFSIKKNLPFSCTTDTDGSRCGMNCCADARVVHTSYNLNPANEAEIRCILSVSVNVFETNTLELIDDVFTAPSEPDRKKGIVIYFVRKNDTIWDISKKYRVSQNDILMVNKLDDASLLCEGMKLLIPSC